MNNLLGTLSDEEVRQIALLVETLDKSTFDFLQLELGDIKVTIGKDAVPPEGGRAPAAVAVSQAAVQVATPTAVSAPIVSATPVEAGAQVHTQKSEAPVADGDATIVSPMIGRYYAQPEPGAAPFVSVGAEVNPDTTVALIEVMKVFTAVRAGVHGIITETCVDNDQYVEYGQILYRVRAAAADLTPESARGRRSRKGSRT